MVGLARAMCAAAVAASLLIAVPATATADEPPACRIDGDAPLPPDDFNRMLDLAATGPVPDARQMFGPQFAFFWGQSRDLGWYVGVAPGPIDLEAARAYLLERVDVHYSGEDAQLLRERLHVVSQPYGEPELRAIQKELADELVRANWGVGWALSVSCTHSDAFRVELELFNASSDSQFEEARRLAARWGDRVIVVRLPWGPPHPDIGLMPPRRPPIGPAPPTRPGRHLELADLLAGRPCARDEKAVLRVRRSARARIERLTVTARGRRTVFRGRRLSRPLRVQLARRTRTIRIAVRLRDGVTVSGKRRLRTCRRG